MSEKEFHVEITWDNALEVWSTREIVYAVEGKIPGQYSEQAKIISPGNNTSFTLTLEDTDSQINEIDGQLVGDLEIRKTETYITDDSGKRRIKRQLSAERLYTLSLDASINIPCALQLGNNLVTLLWQEYNGEPVMGSLSKNGTFVPGPLIFELPLLEADGIIFINTRPIPLTTTT